MNTLANLARVLSVTTGQGTLTLSTAVPGFNTFAGAGITDGQTVTYAIEDYSSDTPATVIGREIGAGVYSAGTLTRATVYSSTFGGSKLNCSGRQHVFITASAEDFTALATDLTTHLNDTSAAHAASAVAFTPAGNVASTDVQAAIAELDSEKLSTSAAASAYQPLDADLTTLSANITAFGHSLVDDADASTARTTLGLGTAAVKNTGTSGNNVALLDGTNTWSGFTTYTANLTVQKASAVLRVASTSGDANGYMSAVPGSAATFRWGSWDGANHSERWLFGKDVTAESGSNAGSDFVIYRYSDAGAFLATLMTAYRADGSVNWRGGLYSNAVTGGSKGNGTLNFGTLYENGTSLASKYQGLDSELTAIAGLTSAADRLPYFTGSGTASLATFTAAGRALVDDADASAQRTTLGLGTAAVKSTGTSGNNVALLDGGNTWSAQNIFTSASNLSNILAISTEASSDAGPFVTVRRAGGSPAASDNLGVFNFQGQDSALNNTNYAQLASYLLDPTDGSEDASFGFNTVSSGTLAQRFYVQNGVYVAGATGADQGTGTLNAVTLYENGTSLVAKYAALGTTNTFTAPQRMPSYTVAGLPAGGAGDVAFTSNGRKNGEGAGLGTGVLVFHDGTAWRACDTGATVAA